MGVVTGSGLGTGQAFLAIRAEQLVLPSAPAARPSRGPRPSQSVLCCLQCADLKFCIVGVFKRSFVHLRSKYVELFYVQKIAEVSFYI